jgi:hypothetical protein
MGHVAVTREEVGTLVGMLMVVLDDRRDRGEISEEEWGRLATLLSRWTVMWLRDATDGTACPAGHGGHFGGQRR